MKKKIIWKVQTQKIKILKLADPLKFDIYSFFNTRTTGPDEKTDGIFN